MLITNHKKHSNKFQFIGQPYGVALSAYAGVVQSAKWNKRIRNINTSGKRDRS